MYLLISTPLHLFLLNPATRELSCLRSGDGYYFGITFKEGMVITTHTGGYLQYFTARNGSWMTKDHLVQAHQAEWVDGNVLVANTGRNCLSVYGPDGSLTKDIYVNSIQWDDKDRGREGNHFNSVHRVGDRIYMVAHNYQRPSEVWMLSWPDLQVIEKKVTGAAWAHNIWIGEWGMVICDSKNGALYEVLSGKTIWKSSEQPIMSRGLAASAEYIFVGRSHYNIRKDRFWMDGGVWILDRKTLKLVETIELPGIGDVEEIRLIESADDCHNNQIIELQDLDPLKKISPIIQCAYDLRKRYPSLRGNYFPISQIVRSAQMVDRMHNVLNRKNQKGQLGGLIG